MILYFLRHGLAGDREDWHHDDSKRPLTDKGKSVMKRVADTINDLVPDLDVIVTSPLVRARQTAEIVAHRLGMDSSLVEDKRLSPGFGIEALMEIVREQEDAKALMFVGHEPDFSQTLSDLIGGGRLVAKKGGLARVDLTSLVPLQGDLVWLAPPKVLAR